MQFSLLETSREHDNRFVLVICHARLLRYSGNAAPVGDPVCPCLVRL